MISIRLITDKLEIIIFVNVLIFPTKQTNKIVGTKTANPIPNKNVFKYKSFAISITLIPFK